MTNDNHIRSGFQIGMAAGLALAAAFAGAGCMAPDAAADPTVSTSAQELTLKISEGALARARCPRTVPPALNPPADATLQSALFAAGTQNYVCATPAAGGSPAWTLKAPHAVLLRGLEPAVIHYAGPSWQALDGSIVVGTRSASAPAPDTTNIPWLLLQAASHVGTGELAGVTWIQRLDTVRGVAPATGCDDAHVSTETLVPYQAQYFFYVTAAAGAPIRQCAGR